MYTNADFQHLDKQNIFPKEHPLHNKPLLCGRSIKYIENLSPSTHTIGDLMDILIHEQGLLHQASGGFRDFPAMRLPHHSDNKNFKFLVQRIVETTEEKHVITKGLKPTFRGGRVRNSHMVQKVRNPPEIQRNTAMIAAVTFAGAILAAKAPLLAAGAIAATAAVAVPVIVATGAAVVVLGTAIAAAAVVVIPAAVVVTGMAILGAAQLAVIALPVVAVGIVASPILIPVAMISRL